LKKRILIYALVLASLILASAACGATATPTVLPPIPTRAQSAPVAAPTVLPTQPAAAPTVAPATATRPPATATAAPQPAATAVPTKAPTASPLPAGDPRDAILKAMKTQMGGKSYRVRQTSESSSGKTQSIVEFVPPDRYHITTNVGTNTTEMIIAGKKAYQKIGDKWLDFPVDVGSFIQALTSAASEEAGKGISDVKLVGPDVLDGVPTLVYTYNSKAKFGDIETSSSIKLWVAVSDGLPRKMIVEGEAMGIKSTTTQLIEYDPSIKIEAPI